MSLPGTITFRLGDTEPAAPAAGRILMYYKNDNILYQKNSDGVEVPFISGSGTGTVTSVNISGSNGITSIGGPITTSGTISLGLSDITPTSVAATGTVTGSNLSGTNTGDQTITLTGDVTGSGTGSFSATLANTGVTPDTYGDATTVPQFTVDSKGRITNVTGVPINPGSVTSVAASGGTTGLFFSGSPVTSSGTLTLNGTLSAANGGTGQSLYITGDILYADTTSSLNRLAGVATGNALISGGASSPPAWGKIGLATHVSGVLPVINGGTGATTSADAANSILPSQTGNSGRYLTTDGNNVSWAVIGPAEAISSITYSNDKITGYTIGTVIYTVTYPANEIHIDGSDGSSIVITLDGFGRISGIS